MMKTSLTAGSGRQRKRAVLLALLCVAVSCPALAEPARNVILLIGDGMGLEQVKAARCYLGTNLSFETWTSTADVATASASAPTATDSAAAGTAMATGSRVNNRVISVRLPGDGGEMKTILEYLKGRGRRTGLVSTTDITDATPAVFGAHANDRGNTADIANDLLSQSHPNVLYGGSSGLTPASATAAGYTVVTSRAEMQALDPAKVTHVSGQFGVGDLPWERQWGGSPLPHLSEMTTNALSMLTNHPAGFFLMVEGALIDHACHNNDITNMIPEVLGLNNAVKICMAFATNRTDTLVLVTADHETGGLRVLADNGPGVEPTVSWTVSGHTASNVGCWAWGPGSAAVRGFIDNTNIYETMIKAVLTAGECSALSNTSASALATSWTVATGEVQKLEYCTNLIPAAWTTVTAITATTTTVTITDTNTTGAAARFYRLITLPE